MSELPGKVITADKLRVGQWISHRDRRFNQRVVDVSMTRDGQIKAHTDYGNGGEPATEFYEASEQLCVL